MAGKNLSDFKYKAFISYSWADRAHGEWLHRALETYRAPEGVVAGASLHPIFRDREDEAAGASIGASIEAALGAAEFLIVLCSPRSAQSKWVNREVAWFKTHRDPKKILALIVDGEPMASLLPGREAEECFPKTLLCKVAGDLAATDEFEDTPLAADARETGDGKRGAKLKLAAAMLGVGYDALARRDDKRRAQRRRLVYAGLASLSAVLGSLAIFAFTQRNSAIVSKKDAEFQRDEAQSLVEFMLTDLRKRLDAVGRLDVLDAVAQRLLDTYAKQDIATLDADALGRRARVLMLLGEVDSSRGDLDAALARYTEAAATTAELLRRAPDNEQRIFDHAQSVYWVGDIAWKRGDVATVTDYWTQYRDFGARLVALDPDNDAWQTELGYGYRNLGTLAIERGDSQNAIEAFSRARDVSKHLAESHPEDSSLQIAYADDLLWLAIAEDRHGTFANAEKALLAEAAVNKSLLARDSENDAALQRRSVNARMTALLALSGGDARRALAILEDQVTIHQARLAHDPQNTIWLDFSGRLHTDIANARLAIGELASARDAADQAITVSRYLTGRDPSNVNWKLDNLGYALLAAARTATTAGDYSRARSHIAQSEALLADIERDSRNRVPLHKLTAMMLAVKGNLLAKSGERQAARAIARDAIAGLEALVPISGPFHQTCFVELYLLAGRAEEAAALAGKLYDRGYRHPDFMRLRTRLASLQGGGDDDAAAQE